MRWFTHKPTYTQEEIRLQQKIVAEAIDQRESLHLNQKGDLKRADTSVEVAQEILNFMLEEIEKSNHG